MPTPIHSDTVIVGSGFSGLAMAVALKSAGREDFAILERAGDIGGTWRDNSYPGCACDVPSHLYSFSFAPNPEWSSTFSPQPEIQAYLKRVAARHGVLPHVRLKSELESAHWDDLAQRWRIETARGPVTARVLISAAGPLSEPSIPDLPGLERFAGKVFHSAAWDHDHRLEGERVAVIGTGASAIQFVPRIQPRVRELHLYQRTPPWIIPRPDRPLRPAERVLYRRVPLAQWAIREGLYWAREAFAIPMLRVALAPATRSLALRHLGRQVRDPALRAKLTPDYLPGCKRILVSNDYYPAVTRDNVEVVTDGIAEIGPRSIESADGTERPVDTIIFGTGFHVTDPPIAERAYGRDGRTLAAHWDGSPSAHRGTMAAGFPNLFFVLGPNTGLGHTSVVIMAEAQVKYIMRALAHMDATGTGALEPRAAAQQAWNEDVQRRLRGTVWTAGGCQSWYTDRQGRNTTLWPDFTFRFARALKRFDPSEYEVAPARMPVRSPDRIPIPA